MAKKKRFQFQLGLPGLIFVIGLLICLFLWMFILGFYFGQRMMASRVEKLSSPVSKQALGEKKAIKEPPPVFEEVKPPPLVGEEVPKEKPSGEKVTPSPKVSETKPLLSTEETFSQRESKSELEKKQEISLKGAVKSPKSTPVPQKTVPKVFYSVQVASLRSQKEAQRYVKYLRDRGYEAFFKRVVLPQKGIWFRVYVGRFHSLAEAKKFGEELKRREKLKAFYVQKLRSS